MRDPSRFFRSRRRKFQKTFSRYPAAGSLFPNGIPVPESACVRLPPFPSRSSRALALARSPQLSLACLSLLPPLSRSSLRPPPSPYAAPSPRLSRPRPSPPPRARRSGSQAAGGAGRGRAAEQPHSAAAAARRWRRERRPRGELGPPPSLGLTCRRGRKLTDSGLRRTPPSLRAPSPPPAARPTLRLRAGFALQPLGLLPRPLGPRVPIARGGRVEAGGRGVQSAPASLGLGERR